MSAIATVNVLLGQLVTAEGHDIPFDDKGYTTEHPILPPKWELIIGTAASLIVFAMLYKFAWPVIRQSFKDRTAKFQKQIDDSAAAKATAETEAARIRQAKGDIDAERERLYAEADAQAEALLADGRARLDAEIVDLEARADADVAAAAGRGTDELRAEIARHAGVAVDRIVAGTLDDSAQQELIEGFISRVGQSTGASA
jgi:F-type H+-transporting ATPase subunit b